MKVSRTAGVHLINGEDEVERVGSESLRSHRDRYADKNAEKTVPLERGAVS